MGEFKIHSKFKPTGDQPAAIESLANGIKNNEKYQTLLEHLQRITSYCPPKIFFLYYFRKDCFRLQGCQFLSFQIMTKAILKV